MSRLEPDPEYEARKVSPIPYPTDHELDRFVGQRFVFYPAWSQYRDHEPLSSTVTGRESFVLQVPRDLVYIDRRPVLCISGNSLGQWGLVLAGCDLGNSGDGDRRTIWGRIEFPDLK